MNDPIVVDFEGFTGKPPVLVGVLVDGVFAQTAFTDVEPALAMAAQAKGLKCGEFAGFCRELIKRARAERRAISASRSVRSSASQRRSAKPGPPMSSTSMPSDVRSRGVVTSTQASELG